MKKRIPDKYWMYEQSVQSPEHDTGWFATVFKQLRRTSARHLREDFCGTFQIACEWVNRSKEHTAVCLDLDPEPLAYGRKMHYAKLRPDARKRLRILEQNVLSVTKPAADIIIAYNFSFFVFKDRPTLVEYFRCCLKSLGPNGILLLEMAGGPGFVEKSTERRTIKDDKGKKQFMYFWHQKSYDPITHEGMYAIHFRLNDGTWIKNPFVYDWRVWTVRELREALVEAGFKDTCVFWENEHEEYVRSEKGSNDWSWLAYVVGMK